MQILHYKGKSAEAGGERMAEAFRERKRRVVHLRDIVGSRGLILLGLN